MHPMRPSFQSCDCRPKAEVDKIYFCVLHRFVGRRRLMLRILSSERRLCDGLSRRDLLHVGGLGLCGLGLPQLLAAETAPAERSTPAYGGFGRAKSCILLYLFGGSSQLETFDMKPHSPAQIRGTMRPIPSSLPGADVCEHLPEV